VKNKIIINSNRLIRIKNKRMRNHINEMANKIILSLLPYWWLCFLLANYILIYQKGYGKYSKKKVKKQMKSIYLVSPEYHELCWYLSLFQIFFENQRQKSLFRDLLNKIIKKF
jgi:hypothetical protein